MKKTVSLFLAVFTVISMIPAAAGFADVDDGAWYAEAVDYVVSNKLMNGYSADEFGVGDTLSRAMIAQILFNKEGQPAPAGTHGFTDVPADQWFNNAVTWATDRGIMSGKGSGKFAPNEDVTIEQIAVILWNYSGNPKASGAADAVGEHSSWATNGLSWAAENGVLRRLPYSSVTESATRAQTALLLFNYLTGWAANAGVTGISLDITEHKMGEDWTQYLTATLYPAGIKDTITWTSSNPKVATVNEKGKVSGVAGGETVITATTSNGKTATCKIEVWHSHKLTKTTPATCTGAGAETYTCAFCGHSYDKYLPPLGGSHTWSSGTCSKCKVSAYDYNAVAAVVNTGYKGYDMLLGEYSHAMSLGSASAIARFSDVCAKQGGGEHFSEYFVGEQLQYNGKLTYALYDIDANGIPELLVGDSYHDDFLLYALNAAGNVVYINESAYNYPLCILTNGRILLEGHLGLFSGNYTLLRLGANGKTTVIESAAFDSQGDWGPGYNMISEDAWYARVEKLKKDSVMSKLEWNALP